MSIGKIYVAGMQKGLREQCMSWLFNPFVVSVLPYSSTSIASPRIGCVDLPLYYGLSY